ncbi:MAG: hypothetical protein ACRD43_11600, partial [Pyrinomonadaceae bacterium]
MDDTFNTTTEEQEAVWETYEPYPAGRRGGFPQVTITKRGTIRLNRYLTRRIDLTNGVVLLFDSRNGRIGIRPAESDSSLAVVVHRGSSDRYAEIHALSFLKRFGIKVPRTIIIDRINTTPNGLITLNLA